ncbi:MAG: hypothetical protein R3B13_05475 [Polyangiaceae bacterium]
MKKLNRDGKHVMQQKKGTMMNSQRALDLLRLALIVTTFGVAASCSGDSDSKKSAPPTPPSEYSSYSIKIFAGPDKKKYELPPAREVDFKVPLDRLIDKRAKIPEGLSAKLAKNLTPTDKQASSGSGSGTKSKPMAEIGIPDGGVSLNGTLRDPLGWALVYGAAYECGMGQQDFPKDEYPQAQVPKVPPWQPGAYYVFDYPPAACDPQLAYLEVLTCVASKLAEVADSPGVLQWGKVPVMPSTPGMPPGPWEIFPQDAKNRFIARDLSMHTLAIAALTDLQLHPDASGNLRTCATAYADAATVQNPTAAEVNNIVQTVFGENAVGITPTYFPPKSIPIQPSTFAQHARSRLSFNTHVLRAASRLLREQIPKGVYADMAGGERQRARATDPARGARLLWGAESDANEAYNSLAHSTRLLAGRWERGVLEDASYLPCGGIEPMDTLKAGLGPEFSARSKEQPIRSSEQRDAARLMQAAGIVLPEAVVLQDSTSGYRAAIKTQLIENAAKLHGVSAADPDFTTWGEGRAVAAAFDEVSDENLRFGLLFNLKAYQQLTTSDGTSLAMANPGGGLSAGGTVGDLNTAGGIAVDGGIPNEDLATDYTSRAGRISTAAQCAEYLGWWGALDADLGYIGTFQDSLLVGDAFRRRLVVLREEATRAFGESVEPATIATAAAVEARTWTGLGRMILVPQLDDGGTATHLTLYLVGFNPSDFGVSEPSQIADQIGLVFGEPWVADCAAGLRGSCPDPTQFEQDYVAHHATATVWTDVDPFSLGLGKTWARFLGADGTLISLEYDLTNPPSDFHPVFETPSSTKRLYVTSKYKPGSPNGVVFGTLALRSNLGATTALYSKFKGELIDNALGVSPLYPTSAIELGGPSTSQPPAYCIDGLDREPFVPLENELTSDGDGYEDNWAHYLQLAASAATRADELGKELIQIGLDRDIRREGAGKELAEECGDYSALDSIEFDKAKGEIKDSLTDEALNICLNEPTKDIVFLSELPPALIEAEGNQADPNAARDWLRANVLKCGGTGKSNPLCDQADLSYDTLKLAPFFGAASTAKECESAVQVVASLASTQGIDAKKLQQVSGASWFSEATLASAISRLRVSVTEGGDWTATAAGAPVMSSTNGQLWPGCLEISSGCASVAEPGPTFDRVFRADGRPLAPPFGTPLSPSSKMMLLWRVQGAAWLLGGMSGSVPSGTFEGFVPAAPLFEPSWALVGQVPLPLVYAHSRYLSQPSGWTLDPINWSTYSPSDTDRSLMGMGVPVGSGFNLSTTTAPQWIKDTYNGAPVFHVAAKNRAFLSREAAAGRAKTLGYGYEVKPDSAGAWLAYLSQALEGLACDSLDGPPTKTKSSNSTARRQIGNVKFGAWDCWGEDHLGMVAYWGLDSDSFNISVAAPPSLFGCFVGHNVTTSCAKFDANLASFVTRPERCGPNDRLVLFTNAYPPLDNCQAAAQLTQAVALGCTLLGDGYRPLAQSPGEITEVADIQKLERWVGDLTQSTGNAVSRLYLTGVPERVVEDFREGDVGTGSLQGNHGKLVLQLETAIRDISTGYGQLSGTLSKIRSALQQAEYQIDLETLKGQVQTQQTAIARWQAHSKIINSAARTVNFGISDAFNPVGVVANAAAGLNDIDLANKELSALNKIDALNAEIEDSSILLVLNQLDESTNTLYTDVHTSLSGIQTATATAAQLSESLRFSKATAQYYAAVGSGADFYTDESGKVIELPVNIVQNRLYDITKRRYETALKEARYLAYIARLAIEQRLGVRLDEFTESIGPLDAPASWAEDICVATGVDYGINYEKLRDIEVPDGGFSDLDGGTTNDAAKEFAHMYIGDYVDKLQKFVEFYNMEFPAHDGDDTTVLSLRDDLIGPGGTCFGTSPNLLLYSSDLRQSHRITSETGDLVKGWQLRRCEPQDPLCLQLEVGSALSPVPEPANPAPGSGVTWLKEVDIGSITDEAIVDEIQNTTAPARIVYQTVSLGAGPHVLSWWDQARDSSGAVGTTPQEYPITVYDDTWSSVKTTVESSHVPDATGEWKRRELTFNVATPGNFHIAFAAGSSGAVAGSVAISDVQLELGSVAGSYVPNGSSRVTVSTLCAKGSPAQFQNAFEYRCSPFNVCYYELAAPFIVDSSNLLASQLSGKIAAENFNYRHVSLALNVVGTGVVDCSLEPTPSCFGSAYVDYTLDHAAFDVVVLSHKRPPEGRHFNFGLASINHGKALAAERFITLPVGSADSALLSQPSFDKIEFRGRPIEGNYRLRIFDKPSLRWNKVEDVQFVLKYRYWSRIQPQAGGK